MITRVLFEHRMKKALVALALIAGLQVSAQVKLEHLEFEKDHIDFGTIYVEDGPVKAVYSFKNTGPIELVIERFEVACGCTQPKIDKKRIPPGDSATITAEFNPTGLLGNISKWIHIEGNFEGALYKALTFKAEVISNSVHKNESDNTYYPGQFGYVVVLDPLWALGNQVQGFEMEDSIRVMNDGYNTYEVTSASNLPDFIQVTNLPITIAPKEIKYIKVKIDSRSLDTIGPINGTFHLQTTDKYYKQKELTYSFYLSEDFSKMSKKDWKRAPQLEISERVVQMGNLKAGQIKTKRITFTNAGKNPLQIYRVDADCACAILEGDLETIPGKSSVEVTVRFDAVFKKGDQNKIITLYTNDPDRPVVTLKVVAFVD